MNDVKGHYETEGAAKQGFIRSPRRPEPGTILELSDQVVLAVLRLTTSSNFGRLFDRQVGRLGSAQQLDELSGHDIPIELDEARPVPNKTSLLGLIRPLVYCWQVQAPPSLDDQLPINEEKRRRQNVKCHGV